MFYTSLDQGEKDDKIIAVCADDPEVRHYTDINQLPPHRLAEIRRFFEDCILIKFSYKLITYQRIFIILSKQVFIIHEFGTCLLFP